MSEKKIIAVLGATGAQGGGLVRAIHADPNSPYRARAITRNPKSDSAKALAALGAEVVAGDVDDQGSMQRAFAGAYGAFCVTFFWAHMSPATEIEQAQMMAQACKQTGVKHVVWSTLEDTRRWVPLSDSRMPTLQGKYKVPHFDAKGEANHFFTDAGLPVTLYNTSFYWDNLIHFGMGPKPGPNGELVFGLPMGDRKLPGIAAEDIGKCAYGVFQRGKEFIGKTIAVSGENVTGAEMAAALSRVLGKTVRYQPIPFETYRNFGFPGADDLGNMFQVKHDFNTEYCAARNPDFARSLNPALLTFERWAALNKDRIPTS